MAPAPAAPPDPPPQPHDAWFKWTFSQRRHAVGLLRAALPAAWVAQVDFRTLHLENTTFVNRALRRRQSDLIAAPPLAPAPASAAPTASLRWAPRRWARGCAAHQAARFDFRAAFSLVGTREATLASAGYGVEERGDASAKDLARNRDPRLAEQPDQRAGRVRLRLARLAGDQEREAHPRDQSDANVDVPGTPMKLFLIVAQGMANLPS